MATTAPDRLATETLLATAASTVTLSLLAKAQHMSAAQPLNATSHWLNGDAAAQDRQAGWRTTGVGLATHLAATGFWAVIYERWLVRRRSPAAAFGKALAVVGLAALVDYRATPKRFTPGWELVFAPASMLAAYLALAGGLAVGGLVSTERKGAASPKSTLRASQAVRAAARRAVRASG